MSFGLGVTSIFLTVVLSLFDKYQISPSSIGRLEIGTETLIDKSKSVKTSLMSLFGDNTDIEGITSVNACYGGTAALFNSLAWLESSEWDGRYALVVCGDIAVYESGPARPTGGVGALAMLLGPNAPLVLEPGIRASHNLDVYDFYKPKHSEYAVVDGRLSQKAYLSSVDACYTHYKSKYSRRYPTAPPVTASHFDYFAFHSPYNKLVQKGFGRLFLCDGRDPTTATPELTAALAPFVSSLTPDETYEHRDLETTLRGLSLSRFNSTVLPACSISKQASAIDVCKCTLF